MIPPGESQNQTTTWAWRLGVNYLKTLWSKRFDQNNLAKYLDQSFCFLLVTIYDGCVLIRLRHSKSLHRQLELIDGSLQYNEAPLHANPGRYPLRWAAQF